MVTMDHLASHPAGTNRLAPDLTSWLAPETLANLALSVAQGIDDDDLHFALPSFDDEETLPPRLMLALLTYAYATGFYASRTIADQISVNPTLQYFCARKRPPAPVLRRFRRQHRETLARCLELVGFVAWRIQHGNWSTPRSSSARAVTPNRVDPMVQIEIRCEVMDRLQRAEIEDSFHVRPMTVTV
jgi:hypothetical protein